MDPVHYIRNCFRAIRNWFRHHTFLIKTILFIIGLVWSSMMEKAFVRILISGGGKVYDLPSVVVLNFHHAMTSVFILIFTYATGGCLLRFFLVVLSTISSFLGVIYYKFLAAGNGDKEQLHLCLGMVVMALAQAALTVTLKDFLDDHFRPMCHDYYQRKRISKLLWSPVSLVAAEFSHLEPLMVLSITVMLCLFSAFLICSFNNTGYDAMTTGYVRATEADNGRRVEARPVYLLLLWVCLLISSLVSTSPSTEASPFKGRDYLTLILYLDNLLRFWQASFRELEPPKQEMMELLKIGMALSCPMLCFATGAAMSVHWLTPLFFILGLAVELAKDGFESLYESQVPSHLRKYGSALGELAKRLGGLQYILCIIIFGGRDSSWFQDDVDNSSFNMHSIFRAVLSTSNFILFLLVAIWYKGSWVLRDDEEIY